MSVLYGDMTFDLDIPKRVDAIVSRLINVDSLRIKHKNDLRYNKITEREYQWYISQLDAVFNELQLLRLVFMGAQMKQERELVPYEKNQSYEGFRTEKSH